MHTREAHTEYISYIYKKLNTIFGEKLSVEMFSVVIVVVVVVCLFVCCHPRSWEVHVVSCPLRTSPFRVRALCCYSTTAITLFFVNLKLSQLGVGGTEGYRNIRHEHNCESPQASESDTQISQYQYLSPCVKPFPCDLVEILCSDV